MSEIPFTDPAPADLAAAAAWLKGATVGIAGLGLMGGSLGMALRAQGVHIIGWTRSEASATIALQRGCVDELRPGLPELCAASDVLVLATPLRALLASLDEVSELARPGTLVIDLGSTKSRVVERMGRLPETLRAVGGHPMCGKDRGGPEAADGDLYMKKVFVLSPTARTDAAAWARSWALAEALGAQPTPIDAARHDRLAALISHVPYVAAGAVVGAAEQVSAGDDLVWRLAASGFRDTTRVAASELDVMLDILLTNSAAVSAGLSELQRQLADLQALLDAGDAAALRERLAAAQLRRRSLFTAS